MDAPFDPLYGIFEKHLHSGLYDTAVEQELIDAVVTEYLVFLTRQGVARSPRDEQWRENVAAEVRDMLKMKTYGHFNVRHYNLSRRNPA